ncbi:hypothetical protein [Nocardia sp. NPDC047038]|uniref:hypothetical protein n=1 Tax=Nocardia sp. NPDC047038 TaxID=3154338 RepID=UPI0033F497FC
MSEKIAGKTFSTPEEAGVAPMNPDQIAEALRKIDEGKRIRDSFTPKQRKMMSPKFSDDLSDTEFEEAQKQRED